MARELLSRDQVPALSVRRLGKAFGGTAALTDVDLDVGQGQVHALVGENGSGKSTLIKIISGYHRPDSGSVAVGGQTLPFGNPDASHAVGARFVHQNLGLVHSISVLDNLALQRGFPTRFGTIARRQALAAATEALAAVSLEVDPEALAGDLTPAERTGVAIARAFSRDTEPRLLVLDEPTATLPEREVSKLTAIVRAAASRGVGILYVTHRLDEVFELAEVVTVLRDGRVHARTPVAQLTRQALVRQLVGNELSEAHRESAAVPEAAGRVVLEVAGLTTDLLDDVSLQLRAGEIVGVAGITGSGRETVCAAVFGAVPKTAGRVLVGGKLIVQPQPHALIAAGVAMIPADRERLGAFFGLTARENLTITGLRPHWRRGLLRKGSERKESAKWFRDLDVRPASAYEKPLGSFSGGNQQKLVMAKWLRTGPKVLLVDEPTQGVDIGAKATLHHHLLEVARGGAGVLMSSTDTDELAALCHRVLIFQRGHLVRSLSGAQVTQGSVAQACVAQACVAQNAEERQ
jgi:ribose transport system ATP-binding protein